MTCGKIIARIRARQRDAAMRAEYRDGQLCQIEWRNARINAAPLNPDDQAVIRHPQAAGLGQSWLRRIFG